MCVYAYTERKMDSKGGCDEFPHPEFESILVRPESNATTLQNPKSTAEIEFEFKSGGLPKPLESLHEPPIPPFLSKTYDLVSDPSLDGIISWGEKGNTFVVWNPLEFSRMVLPRNFKHSNFSSFVRQLNTYGFRKIDTDKWEFANEGFVKGQRHLLKGIQRRRSHQTGTSREMTKAPLGGEIEGLRKERSLMMQELVQLQHEQRGTAQHMDVVKKKLEATEKHQKQMVSFLSKMLQKPGFLNCLTQAKKQKSIGSTGYKCPKLQADGSGTSAMEQSMPFGVIERTSSWEVELFPEDLVTDMPELLMAGICDAGYEGSNDVPGPWGNLVHGNELGMSNNDGVADLWGTGSQHFGGSLEYENYIDEDCI